MSKAIATPKWNSARAGLDLAGDGEPLIPLPSAKVRRWLFGAIWGWQVAILWLAPFAETLMSRIFGRRIEGVGDDLFWEVGYFDYGQIGIDVVAGVTIAVSANFALLAAKYPAPWIWRFFLVGAAFCASMLGCLATLSDSWIDLVGAHSVILGVLVFLAMTLGWNWFPGLGQVKWICLDASPSSITWKSQFRLIHLFYLMSLAAILLGLARLIPLNGDLGQILHEPVELAICFGMFAVMCAILFSATQRSALSSKRCFFSLLLIALMTPLMAIGAFVVVLVATGQPFDWQGVVSFQCIFGVAYLFICGTGLAMRLIGYRLN